jgi:hypothetical protein
MNTNLTCHRCGAKSSLPLCANDINKLRAMLLELTGEYRPNGKSVTGWLESLAEAATGHTRMGGDNSRRANSDSESPIRFNDKASDLITSVRGTLARIVQDICQTNNLDYQPVRFVRPDFIGPLQPGTFRGLRYADNGAHLAWWLYVHIDRVIASDHAATHYDDIDNTITTIKTTIDRPPELREVGECTTLREDDTRCATYLRADRDAIEVQCPECRTTHNVEKVVQASLARADHMPWTAETIMEIVERYGLQLNARTWRKWRANGVVKPCLYQRPNGRIGIGRANIDDIPLYRLSDVRQAMAGDRDRRKKATV